MMNWRIASVLLGLSSVLACAKAIDDTATLGDSSGSANGGAPIVGAGGGESAGAQNVAGLANGGGAPSGAGAASAGAPEAIGWLERLLGGNSDADTRRAMQELLARLLAAILELVPEAPPALLAPARAAPLARREPRVAAGAAADRAPIPKT